MSTFGGIMNEYKNISIDKFDGKNLNSTAYFLSHCHTDHMKGLSSNEFYHRLKESKFDINLYTSKINTDLLRNDNWYKRLAPFIISIEINVSKIIQIPNKNGEDKEVTVTLLVAGHCPGSVMFLFEGNEGTVLYTGDFRLPFRSAQRYGPLHSGGDVKAIKSIYVDTTFCVPNFLHLPDRQRSCNALIEFTKRCLSQNQNNVLRLMLPAQYGYEHLFVELYKSLKVKIHVNSDKICKFLDVDMVSEAITEDPCTRIHACYSKVRYATDLLPCGYSIKHMKVKTIKVSAMWFEQFSNLSDLLVFDKEKKCHRLFYSTHSSLTEVCDFVFYLNPKNIYPNVVPDETSEKEVIAILNKYGKKECTEEKSGSQNEMLVALGDLTREQNYLTQSSQSSDLLFDDDFYSPVKENCTNEICKKSEEILQNYLRPVESESEPELNEDILLTPKDKRKVEHSDDSTPDEFTPDPKSTPPLKFKNRRLSVPEDHNKVRRKLFCD